MFLSIEVSKNLSFEYEIDLGEYEQQVWGYIRECLWRSPHDYTDDVCPYGLGCFTRAWIQDHSADHVVDFLIDVLRAIEEDYQDYVADYQSDPQFLEFLSTMENLLQTIKNS